SIIGIITDKRDETDAKAAPAALTAFAKAKNDIKKNIPKNAPKISVSIDHDEVELKKRNIIVIMVAIK
ncbi:MAG: hypothetical protein KAR38_14470, partial [Calditrichia bacterium]|nr:hypothetical protein [Calditrichia bacterium]